MKDFFKYVLATAVGLIVTGIVMTIMSLISLIGMASMGKTIPMISSNSVMTIDLDGALAERAVENPFAKLFGSSALGEESIGLNDILTSIKYAKDNDNIKGIYIEAGQLSGATPASLEAIHKQLVDFKKSGKFVISYADNYTLGTYYVCSVAKPLLLNPYGSISWNGMTSQVLYYKDILDKIGINMQVFKVGKYKSAVEPYLMNEMSEANREQITTFTSEIWADICKYVGEARNISIDALNKAADEGISFAEAKTYQEKKFVDKLIYTDKVKEHISKAIKSENDNYNKISYKDVAKIANSQPKNDSGNLIAVYYAEGDIVDEPQDGINVQNESQIIGKDVVKDLKELAENNKIKAVVLRVNSPGGSAFASEQIWNQVSYIKSKKPIVVSMGGYAASGGYYISCAANYIFAEPTTLTGSIGIFGVVPEASRLLEEKIGVHSQVVKTNQYGDIGNIFRPMNENEQALIQGEINRGYELFTKRCADGRNISQDSIKVIGEGRVWTGEHAKTIGLVDELGGLDEAIAYAKKLIKVKECNILSYPAEKSFIEKFSQNLNSDNYANAQLRTTFGEYYNTFRSVRAITSKPTVQTAMPYSLNFNL